MLPTSDNHSLTLSQREMENLGPQETEELRSRATLLSCLLDRPYNEQRKDWNSERTDQTLTSDEISLPELKCSSKASETKKWPNSRLFSKSYELSKKQMLMNTSDKQPMRSTPPRLTSLTRNDVALSNAENMPHSLPALEKNQRCQETGTTLNAVIGEESRLETDRTLTKLGNSYVTYERNSPGSVDNNRRPTLLARMTNRPLGREKESQIGRDA